MADDRDQPVQPATVVAFFSMNGSVGKTLISSGLADAWAERDHKVLLVDADLVSAESSRQKGPGSWCRAPLTSQDLGRGKVQTNQIEVKDDAPVTVVPAAPWVRTENRIAVNTAKLDDEVLSTEPKARTEELDHILELRNLRGQLETQLESAQRAQGEQVFTAQSQKVFWENVLAIARGGRFTHIIVDFPPFGPGGVGQWDRWCHVRGFAAGDSEAVPPQARVTLLRGFVFAYREPHTPEMDWADQGHPLEQNFKAMAKEGVEGGDESLFLVENFQNPQQLEITDEPGYRALRMPFFKSADSASQPMDRLARSQSAALEMVLERFEMQKQAEPESRTEKPQSASASATVQDGDDDDPSNLEQKNETTERPSRESAPQNLVTDDPDLMERFQPHVKIFKELSTKISDLAGR